MGHLRDLPKSSMGVDLEHDFAPQYIPMKEKADLIRELKKAADKFLKENPRYAGSGYRVSTSTSSGSEGASESKNASINDAIRNAARR